MKKDFVGKLRVSVVGACFAASMQFVWVLESDACRPNVGDPLFHEASQQYESGNYKEALQIYEKVISYNDGSTGAKVGKAKCLAKLGDPDAAVKILSSIIDAHPLDDYASIWKIEILRDARHYKEALESCDFLEMHTVYGPEKSCLLRSTVYELMGRHVNAVAEANRAYYHCFHLGETTLNAEEQLKRLDAPVPTNPAPNESKNGTILALLDRLYVPHPTFTKEQLERFFGRQLEESTGNGNLYMEGKLDGTTLFSHIQVIRPQFASEHKNIGTTLNTDLCSITEADLTKQLGVQAEHIDKAADHCGGESHSIRYQKDFGTIICGRSVGGSKCITGFTINWY